MPWLKWLPWRFFIRRIARAHGFLDPVALLARLHRFAQPSEVGEPVELLRAGMVFHARVAPDHLPLIVELRFPVGAQSAGNV